MKQGVKMYFTGRPCPKGHIAQRYVSSMTCASCGALRSWAKQNPDKEKAVKKAYRNRNPELVRAWKLANQKRNRATANARQRRYVEANKASVYTRTEAWAKANPAKGCAKTMRYHADKLQRTPSWSDQDAIQGMYDLAAVFRSVGLSIEVDHVIPLRGKTVSGLHVPDNLQLIHSSMNRSKSNHF